MDHAAKYPYPIPGEAGAISDFLRASGNRLLIAMPDISAHEAKILRRGTVRCGMLAGNGAILLLWQFCDKQARPVLTLDSPFDARKVPDLALHNIDNAEQRLLIDMHIVDSATNMIRGLRAMTMPPGLTLDFLSAVQDQLAGDGRGEQQLNAWMALQPAQLITSVNTVEMGQ